MTPLTFRCEGEDLAAIMHPASGESGLLIVQGGAQTRVGPQRLFVRLAEELAGAGIPVMRFDRRGIGDSGGDDRGFAQAAADIAAAAEAFREAQPQLRTLGGLGHCDGATALLMAPDATERLILVNPWAVEEGAALPAAAARAHYRRRLAQPGSWRRLITGQVNPFPAIGNLFRRPPAAAPAELPAAVEEALRALDPAPHIILSARDRTAQIFKAGPGRSLPCETLEADHAFSRPAEAEALRRAVAAEVERW